jgi:hypothetical protein
VPPAERPAPGLVPNLRLHTLRSERSAALEAGDHAAVTRLDEQEISVLDDVAYAAEIVNDQL